MTMKTDSEGLDNRKNARRMEDWKMSDGKTTSEVEGC